MFPMTKDAMKPPLLWIVHCIVLSFVATYAALVDTAVKGIG